MTDAGASRYVLADNVYVDWDLYRALRSAGMLVISVSGSRQPVCPDKGPTGLVARIHKLGRPQSKPERPSLRASATRLEGQRPRRHPQTRRPRGR